MTKSITLSNYYSKHDDGDHGNFKNDNMVIYKIIK